MDEKKPCKFCERLAWWKENSPKGENGLYTTFQVSLITKTHRKGAGVCGTVTHRAGQLNFCPECGRILKKKRDRPEDDPRFAQHFLSMEHDMAMEE